MRAAQIEPTILQFTSSQADRIGKELTLKDTNQIKRAVARITGVCVHYNFIKNHRSSIPDLRSARENLTAISHHAKLLIRSINSAPLAMYFTAFAGNNELVGPFDTKKISVEELLLYRTINTLSGIISRAQEINLDDDAIREFYLLPNERQKNNNLETVYLWPPLFDIYEQARGVITYSPEGPLVRYIAIVHEALGIEPPSSATIRAAVATWKTARDPSHRPKRRC